MFEKELKELGFSIKNNQIVYDFSDFELFKAEIHEHDCADGTKAIKLNNFRIVNPMEEGYAHMMIPYSLYFRNITELLTLFKLIGYGLPFKGDI